MNKCLNCTKVNFQLDNALSELSSANLIIELLQKELNCINTDKSLVSTSGISNLPQQEPSLSDQNMCRTIIIKSIHEVSSQVNEKEWVTVMANLNPKPTKVKYADILRIQPVPVSNKCIPLSNIQESRNEDSSKYHKDNDRLEKTSRHIHRTISLNQRQQLLLSRNKENHSLDCSIHKWNLPQYIPTVINGDITHRTIYRNRLFHRSSSKNSCKLSDIITSNSNQSNEQNNVNKIVMIGDSHFRDCSEKVKSYLPDKRKIYSVVKPGALVGNLIDSAKEDVKKLTFEDTVILCGGTNNIGKTNISSTLNSINDFVCSNNHTNILLTNVPYQHNRAQYSHVNSEIKSYNKKLPKIIKAYNHTKLIEFSDNRNL
jgi:hypothetical protein